MSSFINAFLDLDPESKSRLKKLEGKAINIELRPFKCKFHCHIEHGKMKMTSGHLDKADTTIRGTPLQMLGVMLDKKNRQRFFADDLTMEGDAEVGQQVTDLFDQLDIDCEEILSHFVGDVPAHKTSQLLRGIKSWVKEAGESLVQDINEYTHEETEWFPAREAVQDFFDDVDELRMDVDRVEIRVKRLLNENN